MKKIATLMREYVDSVTREEPSIMRDIVPITKVRQPEPELPTEWTNVLGRLTKMFYFDEIGMVLPFVEQLLDYELARNTGIKCKYSIERNIVKVSIPLIESAQIAQEIAANADMVHDDVRIGYSDYVADVNRQRENELKSLAAIHDDTMDLMKVGYHDEDEGYSF